MPGSSGLQQRSNGVLWGLLGALGVIGLGYFYVAPQVDTLRDTRLAAAALAADKQSYEIRINEVLALDERLDAAQSSLDQLDLAIPPDAAIDELLVSLDAMAAKSGIVLATIQPATVEGVENGVTVSLTARGSYSGLKLFLETLQTNLRPLSVTSLAVSAASDVSGASLITASMELTAATARGLSDAPVTAAASAGQVNETALPAATSAGPDQAEGTR